MPLMILRIIVAEVIAAVTPSDGPEKDVLLYAPEFEKICR